MNIELELQEEIVLKPTQELKEIYPIPLMPYSYYIQENMRLNDELMHQTTIGSPLLDSARIAYSVELGKQFMKSKIKFV